MFGAVLILCLYSPQRFKQKKVASIYGDANVLVVPCLRPFFEHHLMSTASGRSALRQ